MFAIDKNIEIPKNNSGRGRWPKYPFADMSVGDSIFVEGDRESLTKASVASKQYGARSGKRFTTRSVDGGVRIWRIE